MPDSLEALAGRFFSTVGVVAADGYRTMEVLLDEAAQPHFGGHDYLRLAFSPEAAREHPDAELLTHGSPLLDTMARVAVHRGSAAHFYLGDVQRSTGRTLEKVRDQIRLPGHILEAGEEQVLLFHHALFRFRVTFTGEEREEIFRDVMVDLHTGWSTFRLQEQDLRLHGSTTAAGRELGLALCLEGAFREAVEKLQKDMAGQVPAREELLRRACYAEQKQLTEHYEAMVARLEAGKARKGADPERIEAKISVTRADRERRLQDIEKRCRLDLEIALAQLALVTYPKAVAPVRLQQGKEAKTGLAVWDSLVREGYFSLL
ncbi:MAG: hypothetical protein HY673_22570 [Chloroflexi bacterium]|nr:hypothetical protein [Chloroflexota bacterium]